MTVFLNYKSIPGRLVRCGCPLQPSGHQWAAIFVGLWIKGAVGWRLGTGRMPAERVHGSMLTGVDALLKDMCSFGHRFGGKCL